MQRDVVMAQALSLREMATGWEREALAGVEGASEVAFLMRRAARAASNIIGTLSPDDGTEPQTLPHPTEVIDTREG